MSNDKFVLPVDYISDFVTTASRRQPPATPMLLIFVSGEKKIKFDKSIALCFAQFGKIGFPISSRNFLFYKIPSNNLNFHYPNILTNQTDFCFLKLYFSLLNRTKTDSIKKQPLIDVTWPKKAMWKSAL